VDELYREIDAITRITTRLSRILSLFLSLSSSLSLQYKQRKKREKREKTAKEKTAMRIGISLKLFGLIAQEYGNRLLGMSIFDFTENIVKHVTARNGDSYVNYYIDQMQKNEKSEEEMAQVTRLPSFPPLLFLSDLYL
jgi:hypothetical protein